MNIILNLSLTAVLVKMSLCDLRTYTIPDRYPMMIFLLGILKMFLIKSPFSQALFGMSLSAVPLLTLYIVSKGRGLGGGDVKLMAAAGFYLGGWNGLYALSLGCLGAAAVRIFCKSSETTEQFAFGPYLAFGIWVMAVFA